MEPYLKGRAEDVIVIDSDDESDVTLTNEEKAAAEISGGDSPSMLSPDVPSRLMTNDRKPVIVDNWRATLVCKLEPTECSSVQYLERTHPTSSNANGAVNATGYFENGITKKISQERMERPDTACKHEKEQNSEHNWNQRPQLDTTEMNGTATANHSTDGVKNSPVKKLRKRKLLSPCDDSRLSPDLSPVYHKNFESGITKKFCNRSDIDEATAVGSRIVRPPVILNSISNISPVSVIKSPEGKLQSPTLPGDTRTSESDQTAQNNISDLFSKTQPVSSTPMRPQGDRPVPRFPSLFTSKPVEEQNHHVFEDDRPVPHFSSLSDGFSSEPVKEEQNCVSESSTVRRKRKLCKSTDLDAEKADYATQNDAKLPLFLDSNIIFSHTRKNSRTQLYFIMQLQAQGFALPHSFILQLVQEMMMSNSPSKRDIMYTILWSDTEHFPNTTKKDFLDQLFTTIINSVMTAKYYHTENALMALRYLLNIFCVDWRNSTMSTTSYIATFLVTKTRQLLSEIRKFYERPLHLFCPHIASILQQLVCFPLAVMSEPSKLYEFSQSMFTEVFVELTRDKQKVFLNNLSSPYLITQLIATQLTNDYVPSENRDCFWLNDVCFIDSDWISKLLMLVIPYRSDGTEDLTHMLWLIVQLLAKYVEYQRGGMVLCAPVCFINPQQTITQDTLSNCSSLLEEFLNRLLDDEIIYNTCLFTPEVCYYMKLMIALIEDKTTSNFDDWW